MGGIPLLLEGIAALNAGLAAFVFLAGRGRKANATFATATLAVSLWCLTNAIFRTVSTTSALVLWADLSYAAAIGIAAAILHFALVFPRDTKGYGRLSVSAWILGLMLAALPFVPGAVVSTVTPDREIVTTAGLYPVAAFIGGAFLASLYVLLAKYRHETGQHKKQIRYVLGGSGLAILLGVFFNLALPLLRNYAYVWVGPAASLIFTSTTIYAIAAYHLFDARIIVKRTVVYSVLLASALALYSAVIFFFTGFLGGSGSAFETRAFLTNLVAAGLIAVGYDPLRRWLEDRTDSFLFKKEYERQAVLAGLTHKLNGVMALDEALDIMMSTLVEVLHLSHAATFVFQNGEAGRPVVKQIKQLGYASTAKLYLAENDLTVEYFTAHPQPATLEDLRRAGGQFERTYAYVAKHPEHASPETGAAIRGHAVLEAVLRKLTALDVELAVPLHLGAAAERRFIGLILLSGKRSGDAYSEEDLGLMELVGEQAISAIQKAKLFEGDQMKSEFVSIASHELLTPISAIEGYLSMILDEHIGKVDPTAEEYLGKVYVSAKRLATLVRDLLSVSRIESGKMKFEQRQLDMAKMVADAIDQLKFVAKDKGLTLEFEKPSRALPPVWADSDRAMQVLVNLISNAIKYTPSGSVTVGIRQVHVPVPALRVDITDTGMGISKEGRAHLFQKFYRVATPETTGIMGTGLGLYITKSIVERMGGAIHVKSVPGTGSTFSFTLPLFKVERSAGSPEDDAPTLTVGTGGLQTPSGKPSM